MTTAKTYNKPETLYWNKSACTIKGHKITALPENKEASISYSPFEYYDNPNEKNLYLQFASVNEKKHSEIINFIRKFGFLGLNRKYMINGTFKELYPYEESLIQFIDEIHIMRGLLIMLEFLKKRDIKILNRIEIESSLSFFPLYDSYRKEFLETEDLFFGIKMEVIETVNSKLFDVSPSLFLDVDGFKEKWNCKTLLNSMYVMLYRDILQGRIIRKCENLTCNNYFIIYGNDTRTRFCCITCQNQQRQRVYRERKRSEK